MPYSNTLLVLVIAPFLFACAAETKDDYKAEPIEYLYNSALAQLDAGEFEEAAKSFIEVDRQHPYSVWATKAELMAAFSFYQSNKYDDAIIALDRFIAIHPSNRDIPYAFYLKSLCYYEQISDVGRDQKMTQLALKGLGQIIARFPNSKYARDATLKLDLTKDHLAGKEMEIGRYYEKQELYLGAINRYKRVVEQYQTTTHVPEALHRLTEAYLAIGLVEQAKKTASILGHNFPGSQWYGDAYNLVKGGAKLSHVKEKTWYWPFDGDERRPALKAAKEKELKTKKKNIKVKKRMWYWPFN
jgi:outer membrane protein assembly factor BamD